MPYWLESDSFGHDPVWSALAGGSAAREDALQAAYCRLQAAASHIRSDGWLTRAQALRECRGRVQVLDRLAARVLADRAPRLHRPADQCECLEGVDWRDGYDFVIHGFLKRNPSKAENKRHRAQLADLRDARLKQQVYGRDGGCCRYCRSGPLPRKGMGRARDRRKVIHYDHVDPDRPAGPDAVNLVVACARCNEYKGRRTPAEADMVLLDPPTDAERAAWLARDLTLMDPPPAAATTDATTNTTTDEQPTDALSDALSTGCDDGCPSDDPQTVSAGEVCPDNGRSSPESAATTAGTTPGEGLGSGRVGRTRASVGELGQPLRPPDAPDVYHRRSRGPAPPHLRDLPPIDDHLPDLPGGEP